MLQMDLPSSSTDELQATQNQDDLLILDDAESEFTSPDQLADNLITLSLVSNARCVFENYCSLD